MAFTHVTDLADPHHHDRVAEAWECEEDLHLAATEARAELWAEGAAVRHAELGTPDTWRDEELERMAEAFGTPIPPGFH